MTDNEEKLYVDGYRVAWLSMLQICLRKLGIDDDEAGNARWVSEREETIAMLRAICADYGDNDWDDDLHLADIIEKHLYSKIIK